MIGDILQTVYFIPGVSTLLAAFIWIWSWWQRRNPKPMNVEGTIIQSISRFLYPYIRPIVYALSIVWATWVYANVAYNNPTISSSMGELMQIAAFTGLGLLGVTLIPGVIAVYFPQFPFNALFVHARRALGISAFCFVFVHATIGFFLNLSGNILSFLYLTPRNQIALFCSATAFTILLLLAVTSIRRIEGWLGHTKWKRIHRLVYWAAILAVIHAFMIGSHFTSPQALIPAIVNVGALTLLLLEVGATLIRLQQQKRTATVIGKMIVVLLSVLVMGGFWATGAIFQKPYDPHSRHKAGYSKNYAVNITTAPREFSANEPISVLINVTDKRTGKAVTRFQTVQEKLMHVIVLRSDLTEYQHLHPEIQTDGSFVMPLVLPSEGVYRLYVEYSPPDFLENLSIVTVQTKQVPNELRANLSIGELTKVIGDTKVDLTVPENITTRGNFDFTYTLTDAKTGEPVRDLEPYLAAFGHLAIVNEDGQTYTHVHPVDVPLVASQMGGPQVRFSTFFQKKGLYKLFAQFKRGGELFLTEFVVEVK